MRKNKSAIAELQFPAGLEYLIDDPPLYPQESREEFYILLRAIVDRIKPVDVFDWLDVRDLTLHAWEEKRLWPYKCQIVKRQLEDSGSLGEAHPAEAYAARIDDVHKLDRQLASHERRRRNTLRENERRREFLVRRRKKASAELIESRDANTLVPAD